MPKNIDNIEIVEPPIEELSKKRHGFLKTCLTSCLIIIILIIIGIVALKFSLGPGPKTLKKLPDNFPADVPIYDRENIETITYISGRYKNRGVEIAAFFPKIILSPLIARLAPQAEPNTDQSQNSASLKNIWRVVSTPLANQHDTVQVEWRDLDTSPAFLISYYKKELDKKKFSIDTESEGKTFRQINWSRADGISGSVYAAWTPENKSRSQYVLLTVNNYFSPTTSFASSTK